MNITEAEFRVNEEFVDCMQNATCIVYGCRKSLPGFLTDHDQPTATDLDQWSVTQLATGFPTQSGPRNENFLTEKSQQCFDSPRRN